MHTTIMPTTAARRRNTARRRRPRGAAVLAPLAALALAFAGKRVLPWPCLFASASITHRIASSVTQRTANQGAPPRELANNQYDDDAVNAAMQERDQANAEEGDGGYTNMNNVDFDEVSIMPVSCVN